MRRRSREVNIFSMSALDLFASALGAFILIAVVLFPYFPNIGSSPEHVAALRAQLRDARQQLQASQAELAQARQEEEDLKQELAQARQEEEELKQELAQAQQEEEELKQELAQAKFPHLDLIITLDTTGSMGGPIDGLKEELGEMIRVLSRLAPSLGIGVVAFNDRKQNPVVSISPLKEVSPGSASFKTLQSFINNLVAGEASGDNKDVPEAVYQGFRTAAAMPWRGVAERKIIVVITDAPPYDDEYDALMRAVKDFVLENGRSVSGVWVESKTKGYNATAKFLENLSRNGRGRFVKAGGSVTSSILLALLDS